jgi:hypothetical protein
VHFDGRCTESDSVKALTAQTVSLPQKTEKASPGRAREDRYLNISNPSFKTFRHSVLALALTLVLTITIKVVTYVD